MLRSKSAWLLMLWLMAAFGFLIVLKVAGILDDLDLIFLSDWLRDIGWIGGLLYIIAYTLRPLVLFPATPLTLFGGFVFGAFWGTVYDIIGAGAGAILSFCIARKWGRASVEKLIKGKKLQSFDDRASFRDFGSSGFYWAVAMYVAFAVLPLVLRRMRKR
jgi:uncharacterized membrane protein YdjX (TVP38/TMEM64 family)